MKRLFTVISLLMMLTLVVDAQKKAIRAIAVPQNGNYVLNGDKYTAKIIPFDEEMSKKVRVFVNDKELPNGVYTATAVGVGEKKFRGYMLFGNDTVRYPFSGKYTVGEPSMIISNLELGNILYRGYENKFSISIPGIPNNQISVDAEGATIENKKMYWAVMPTDSAKVVKMTVYATLNKEKRVMGTQHFRVKRLPDPMPVFVSSNRFYSGERVNNVAMRALLDPSGTLSASYGENGLLDVSFKVINFSVQIGNSYIQCEGDKFTQEALEQIRSLRAGDFVLIDNVSAQNAHGETFRLPYFLLFRVR